jgi:serine/threonine-protein kinase
MATARPGSGDIEDDRAHDPVTRILKDGEPREPVEERQILAELEDRLFGAPRGPITLSRYIVLSRLAVGGAGVVYTAYDPELDRRVAIKLLAAHPRRDTADSATRARLLREAQAMARLSHPNVIAVYDVGTYDEDEPLSLRGAESNGSEVPRRGVFVVMELVDGVSLAEWLHGGPHRWRDVLEIFLAAGRGLAAAHAGGVVHRDFKPGNVLVGRDGRVRVLDFGLARALTAEDDGDTTARPQAPSDPHQIAREQSGASEPDELAAPVAAGTQGPLLGSPLTQTGTIMGTPAYMAPEQHRGPTKDERVDQFSFCAALYEGLYGRLPFSGPGLEALEKQKSEGVARPVPRGTRVPAWLHRAVLRGLSPDPEQRFPSMAALLAVLERRARAWRRRLPVAVALLAVAMGAFALVGRGDRDSGSACAGQSSQLSAVWDADVRHEVHAAFMATEKPFAEAAWNSVSRAMDDYAGTWLAMRVEVCQANLASGGENLEAIGRRLLCLDRRLTRMGELTNMFLDADAAVVERAVAAVGALPPLSHCAGADPRMGGELPPDSALRDKLLGIDAELARAEVLRQGGRYAEAIEPAERAVDAALGLGHPQTEARARLVLADLRADAGDADAAETLLHEARRLAVRVGDDELALRVLVALVGVVCGDQARYSEGEALALLAAAKLEYRGLRDDMDAQLAFELGRLRKAQGRYDEALRALDDALELTTRIHGAADPRVADVLNQTGHVLDDKGHYEDALARYESVLSLRSETLGPDHPKVGAALNNVANIHGKLGRHEDALVGYGRALAIYEQGLGPGHPKIAGLHHNVAIVLSNLGRNEEALARHRRGLAIRERTLPPEELLGRYDEALQYAQRALELRERVLGPEHPDVAFALNNVGAAVAELGRHEEALRHLQRALALREAAFGRDHPDVAYSLLEIGTSELALGRTSNAVRSLERALSIAKSRAASPERTADIQFALARALARSDPKRARTLALAARKAYEQSGSFPAELREVTKWLERRP